MKSHAANSAFAPSSLEQSYGTSRSMKPSGVPWLGDIPEGWEVKRGKEILAPLKRPIREDDEIVTCFRDGEVTLRRNRREDGFTVAEKEIGYQGVEKGDLIVHGMDGFAGSIGVSDSRGKASPVLIVLNSTENKRFLMYYLRSLALCDVFLSLSTGIRERSCDLRWNKLGNIPYLLPPLPEQRAIADFLDEKCAAIDAIVEEAKSGIEEYAKWKQSVVFQAVTKGLDPHAKMKDSGVRCFGFIPAHWSIRRISTVARVERGGSPRPIDDYLTTDESGFNWIKIGDTVKGSKYINSVKQKIKQSGLSKTRQVHKGDLVLTNSMSFGEPYILNVDGCIHDGWVCFQEIKSVTTEFLYYVLCSPCSTLQFGEQVSGGVVQNLNVSKVGATLMVVPPPEEQNAIVAYLDEKCSAIDALIEEKKQLIEDLGVYKKSLIYETVTGKRKIA